ncbi:3-hydroxyacyl-ACP dehydratase FabZ family protein [Flavobacterium selenitireducens]|uniref:3-hydroxyacyl-ACP dehydratase FabZ family protein n=1 Tax=Flavobacterium selenitireducens TaxID=2722704 RepID=UPI00168BBA6F|nr:hotdog domain-containing protein [Flavobacterium selenitireducens]MBD3581010.1 hydroxymyristoyl-ACP dehydratase [Flavobacterium selenitireducens]
MENDTILARLPYADPFLFVDELIEIDENGAKGAFIFRETLDFYKGHFPENPVTPGVILTECMAQIGLVCLGIFLLNEHFNTKSSIALTSTEIEFLKPVFPGERVVVQSTKKYFRFGKLKCEVEMRNENDEIVCNGVIAGILSEYK